MSSAFAIAAVTAVLKDLLNNGLVDHDLSAVGNVTVTALPPDRIPATNADERSQLNLFLYQVAPNAGWRNVGLPSLDAGGARISNPPLALDLFYLLTAYGAEEFHAETLLGYAMQLLHEMPVLTRGAINATLRPALPQGVTLPPALQMLATADLAEQVEMIKIVPTALSSEEMSRLWSALQARYRTTAAYQVSVVLIDSNRPMRRPLPVIERGPEALGSLTAPYPTLENITIPAFRPVVLSGETLTLLGHDLAGDGPPAGVAVDALITGRRGAPEVRIAIPAANRTATTATLPLTGLAAALPAGVYSLALAVTPNGRPLEERISNSLPLAVGPRILTINNSPPPHPPAAPINVVRTNVQNGLGTATLNVTCSPNVLGDQRATLALGAREVLAQPHPSATNTLQFVLPAMPAGTLRVRLRIDDIESPYIIYPDPRDRTSPRGFDDSQRVTLT